MKFSKRSKILIFSSVALLGIGGALVSAKTFGGGLHNFANNAADEPSYYTLALNAANAPTASDLASHDVLTSQGNKINVTYTDCEVMAEKHVKINAGGEVVINFALTGVYSGNAAYTGTLKIWVGLDLANMWEANISSTTEEFFSTYKFNYVKLVATTDVVLDSVNLNYSCSEPGAQVVNGPTVNSAKGAIVNATVKDRGLGQNVYMGVNPLGSNNIEHVYVNGVEVEQDLEGFYRYAAGPDDIINVETDYEATGVVVDAYSVETGEKIKTAEAPFLMENDFYGATIAPTIEGYVANQPEIIVLKDNLYVEQTVWYSEVDVWDGSAVSTSFTGDGTEANPYLITSGADLKLFANNVAAGEKYTNKVFKMTKSIDLDSHSLTIGSSATVAFDGKFDGNFCCINNINNTNALFTYLLANGSIWNLTTDGVVNNITGNTVTVSAVLVTNAVAGSSISNCRNYANLSIASSANPGSGSHASFVGKGTCDLSHCTNYGDILNNTGKRYYTAGLVGTAVGEMDLYRCDNFGIVSGGTATGGLVGAQGAEGKLLLESCSNYGDVDVLYSTANFLSGGIIGLPGTTGVLKLLDCKNYGRVNASRYSSTVGATQIGGILGGVFNKATSIDIINCANYGEVEGDYIVGGILGGSTGNDAVVTIDGCENFGYIHSRGHNADNTLGYVGGIMGWARSLKGDTIENCVNWGEVEAEYAEITSGSKTSKGGSGAAGILSFTGGTTNIQVNDCANFGYVHAPTGTVGGIVSGTTSAAIVGFEINRCVNYGDIESGYNVGGIIGIIYQGSTPVDCANYGTLKGSAASTGDIIGSDSRK